MPYNRSQAPCHWASRPYLMKDTPRIFFMYLRAERAKALLPAASGGKLQGGGIVPRNPESDRWRPCSQSKSSRGISSEASGGRGPGDSWLDMVTLLCALD
jgi:hypothetical protein